MSEKITFYVQSLLAGVLIGCGDIVYVVCENKIVGSFLFSLGLISILIKGYPLYTGRIGYVEGVKDFYKPVGGMLPMVLANFAGIAITCLLANGTRLDLSSVDAMVQTKISQSWLRRNDVPRSKRMAQDTESHIGYHAYHVLYPVWF